MKLLLISNSTNAGEAYLKYPIGQIGEHLQDVTEVIFVPYAAVTFSYNEYERKVQERFNEIGVKVRSIHHEKNPVKAILSQVKKGIPYVGWSAGSNVCCPTICTTNDMPIVEPESFKAIGAVKFQINPHYLDANPEGHAGETREQRIEEYIEANPRRYVVGLREGCMLRLMDGKLELIGSRPMRIFKRNQAAYEVQSGDDLSFLL